MHACYIFSSPPAARCTAALLLLLAGSTFLRADPPKPVPPATAPAVREKFARYEPVAQRLLAAAEQDDGAWRKLEELCDDIGHRLSGSPELDQAIDWAVRTLQSDGHENVRKQPVMVPHWVRGRESLELVAPQQRTLHMLGLGNSAGTPPEGITADVIVIRDEAELKQRGPDLRGKIVLFDHPMPQFDPQRGSGYGSAVRYRVMAGRWAQMNGAVAALVRSVTARSIRSPHTGSIQNPDRKGIPTAAVSIEDAMMLSRLQERGIPIRATLRMEAHFKPDAPSANVIAELTGREQPDEIVVIGGHIDSWDVGQGAHDDGAGVVQTMQALTLLRKLDLRPRRTIRLVLWTNEENGLAGAREYARACQGDKHIAALEADSGGFAPRGFSVGNLDPAREDAAAAELGPLLAPLEPIDAHRARNGGGGADIEPLANNGVLVFSHDVDGSTYFDFHHTHGDTLDKVNPRDLARNTAAIAYVAYVLADMPGRLGDTVLAQPPATSAPVSDQHP